MLFIYAVGGSLDVTRLGDQDMTPFHNTNQYEKISSLTLLFGFIS